MTAAYGKIFAGDTGGETPAVAFTKVVQVESTCFVVRVGRNRLPVSRGENESNTSELIRFYHVVNRMNHRDITATSRDVMEGKECSGPSGTCIL